MATSNAMSTSNQYIKYTITVNQNSQSITNNTSSVTVSVRVYRTNTGYTSYGSGTIYCKINGTTYSEAITSSDKITSSGIILFNKTLTIAHNTDGSKLLNTSAWISHDVFSSSEQSYNEALSIIPRASTMSVPTITIGSSGTITIAKASSSFTDTITVKLGNYSTTIATKTTATSVSFTPPITWCNAIPNGTSALATYTITSYNGSVSLGSRVYSATLTVPASVVPTIGKVTTTEADSIVASKFSSFIYSKSKIKFDITSAGVYGSTIKSVVTEFNYQTLTGSSVTTDTLKYYGNHTATVTVTDTRNRVATKEVAITILPYTSPTIHSLRAYRADGLGNIADEGEFLYIAYNFDISPLNDTNAKTYTIKIKGSSESEYRTVITGSWYSLNTASMIDDGITLDDSYSIILTLEDSFTSVSRETNAPTAFTLVDYNNSGKGVAFGKVSTRSGAFECNLDIYDKHDLQIRNGLAFYEYAGSTDANTTLEELFLSAVNTPDVGFWYVRQMFYNEKSVNANRVQIATTYNSPLASEYQRVFVNGTWSAWIERPVIKDEGASGIWKYRKWGNMRAECYGAIPISSLPITTALGSWYRSAVVYDGEEYKYPLRFGELPKVSVQFSTENGTGGLIWLNDSGTTTTPPTCYIIRPTSATSASGYIHIRAEGYYY